MLTFFGLTPEYKKIILDEIFILCYGSHGGYTHDEVYNMPIRYRRYYIQRLHESIEQQNEEINKKFNNNNKGLVSDNPMKSSKLPPPPIPDFATNTRAPKK